MRDPARLDDFYNRIKEAHRQVPDMRIGQLWMNILAEHCAIYRRDAFYTEDDEFVSAFEKIISKWTGVESKE